MSKDHTFDQVRFEGMSLERGRESVSNERNAWEMICLTESNETVKRA